MKIKESKAYDQDKKTLKRLGVHFLEDGGMHIEIRGNKGNYGEAVTLSKELANELANDILSNVLKEVK